MTTETIKTYKTQNVTVRLDVTELPEPSPWLHDLYTGTDDHDAGTTIQVPDQLQYRNGYKFYVGQYTPAQLARDFASQGRDNPSAAAYKSLQDELGYCLSANDCMIDCTVTVAGLVMGTATASLGFEYSPEYDERDLKDVALSVLADYGYDFVREAIQEARDHLARLKSI